MEPSAPHNLTFVSRDVGTIRSLGNNEVLVEPTYNPRLPNGVVVAILMVVGLLGNGLVLYVYHFKLPRTVFSTFVTVLAVLDLTTTLVGMPIDVAIKSTLAAVVTADHGEGGRETLSAICKLAHLEVYSSSLASGSVLLLITITRHTKVCRPLEPGLSKKKARILCAIICLGALVFSMVTLVINGLEPMRIAVGERDAAAPEATNRSLQVFLRKDAAISSGGREQDGFKNSSLAHVLLIREQNVPAAPRRQTEVVSMYICRTSKDKKGTVLYYVLQAVLMTAFVCILLSLLVLHCRISHRLVDFERRRSSMRRFSEQQQQEAAQTTHITASMFRIFASITVIFAVSYLPHLVCLIVEKVTFKPGQTVSLVTRIVMDLAYNFPYINVVANPFIYGYRSLAFRQHCLILLRRFCRGLCDCFGGRTSYR